MKFDLIKSIIILCIAALFGYALYTICDVDSLRWLLTCVGAGVFAIEAVMTFGISLNEERKSIMFNTLSGLVLFATLAMNFIFAFFEFSIPLFVILNGLLLLVYAMSAVSIYRTQK